MPAYVLFGGVRESIVFLCCASHASSGDCMLILVRATVALALSSSLPQRGFSSSTDALLVENWRNDVMAGAQRRAMVVESALKHCLASADIDVGGVVSVPSEFFPQVQPFRRSDHEL